MAKRMIVMLTVTALFVAALGFVKFKQIQTAIAQGAAFQPPPEAVTTILARQDRWPATLSAIGTVAAVQGVTVSADLPGTVDRIAFDSGQSVREGDVLAILDTRQERAQMAAAEAQGDLATLNFERMQGLLNERVISRAEFDRATAEHRQTEARVGEIRAAIDRKTIRAPFSGILGIRQVNLGQYLSGGDPLVTLQSLNPIRVNFGVPQQAVGQVRVGRTVRITADDLASVALTGQVTAIDSLVDEATRNIQVQVTLANPAGRLRPGMFVQAEVIVGAASAVVALPASAISYASFGDSVFIVTDMKDRRRPELPRRAAAVRQARWHPWRPGGDHDRRQSRRRGGDLGRVQAPQRCRGPDQQQSPAGERSRAEAREQLMKFTDLFVKRPVLAIVVNLVILIAGLQSIRALSVRQYPRSDIAVVKVSTVYTGANADLVRGFITTPLERVIASADGIDYMESSSAQGLSTITVRLRLNYDTNDALTQIQAKVAQVRNDLPPEAEAPIIEVENADTQFAALYLSFSSDDLDQNQITDYLIRVVQPRLSAISGVQRADILGDRTFAMRIWIKPDQMAAHGISPSMLREALARNNYLSALGRTKGSMVSVNLVANTDLRTPEEFGQLVVKEQDGVVVRLADIADVVLGAENYEEDVRFNGETAVFMGVWVLPTANSLDVIQRVRAEIPVIQAQMPAGMSAGIPYDATAYIEDAIDEVLTTLSETLLIVIVVIFLFLGSLRSVLVPVVAIPISLVGAVFLMLVAGFTLNLLTLLAIVLSVGLVVDDAIVMVENVERHIHLGKPPLRAAIEAARELVGPIVAMTITLAAVYTPVGIQGGLTGALFREFAFTLAGAVIVSGIVALTLSPMMGARLLRSGQSERGFAGWINRRFDGLRNAYTRTLTGTLHYRPVVLVLWAIVALLTVPFYMFSQRELAPNENQGVVFSILQTSANSTLDQTKLFAEQVADAYRTFPEAAGIFQLTFPTGGFGGFVTKPWSERSKTTEQLMMEVAGPLSQIPGIRAIPLIPPPLPGGGDFPVDMVIASAAEPEQLRDLANQLVPKAFASGLFIFADADMKFDQPQAEVIFDRDKLRSQGVDLSQAGRDLSVLLGGDYVNRFSIQGRSYKVIPQIQRADRLTPDQLSQMYITGSDDTLVPLSTFASLQTTAEPRELKKFQQLNAVRIQGVIPPPVPLDQALTFLENEARAILPQGFTIDYAGESRQLRTEGSMFLGTFLLSAILIYLVLAAQFESFRDPFIILAGSVPLAVSGALLFSFLGLTTLNIYSQVGLITLVGLVSKNGILIVQFANHLQETGKDKFAAIVEAAGTRLRPILMTTAATVVGHFPLVLATGPGAGARNSIGIMLVTGMIIGTVFTLFVVPSIYMLVARTRASVADERETSETGVGELVEAA